MLWILRWLPAFCLFCVQYGALCQYSNLEYQPLLHLLIFLLSPGPFPLFHPFHMECCLFLDRSFNCIVHCIRPNVQGCYIFLAALHYSLGVFTCFWSKLKVEESFSISCSSSLIICLISSLKTSRKLDFICSIKVSFNSSTFSSTKALNSSALRVLGISK